MKHNCDFEYISSKDNEKVKSFAKLSSSKYRAESGRFLAEGVKLTREALAAGAAEYVLFKESELKTSPAVESLLRDLPLSGNVKALVLSDAAFGKVTTESAPQGVITVAARPSFHISAENADIATLSGSRCIALDSVRDPGNVGTVLRSALAFGFDTVIVGSCADIYNTKTVRASMGALFHENIITCADLCGFLSEMSLTRRVLGASLRGECMTLGEYETRQDDVIVIGNEGTGITDGVLDVCTGFVKIPMGQFSESLNASVAASVFMWEYSKGTHGTRE